MQRVMQVPSALITTLNGLVVIFVVSSEYFQRRRQKQRISSAENDDGKPPGNDTEITSGVNAEAEA